MLRKMKRIIRPPSMRYRRTLGLRFCQLCPQWDNLIVADGILYRLVKRGADGLFLTQVVVPFVLCFIIFMLPDCLGILMVTIFFMQFERRIFGRG